MTRRDILQWYDGKLAKWQVPVDVLFVPALPLGATGKTLKKELRRQLEASHYQLPPDAEALSPILRAKL